ncbi:hypothetical protein EIP91_009498 [Steccherinum ochraceum]|uniref:Uncharacterized protein n=1 Tax=Steccherinum ochraceum TaxID=92696 RepID=A0A4R0R499_9APHY|nr:hypothetical protein EIP91_009498 [Steccherinum ochraceum]
MPCTVDFSELEHQGNAHIATRLQGYPVCTLNAARASATDNLELISELDNLAITIKELLNSSSCTTYAGFGSFGTNSSQPIVLKIGKNTSNDKLQLEAEYYYTAIKHGSTEIAAAVPAYFGEATKYAFPKRLAKKGKVKMLETIKPVHAAFMQWTFSSKHILRCNNQYKVNLWPAIRDLSRLQDSHKCEWKYDYMDMINTSTMPAEAPDQCFAMYTIATSLNIWPDATNNGMLLCETMRSVRASPKLLTQEELDAVGGPRVNYAQDGIHLYTEADRDAVAEAVLTRLTEKLNMAKQMGDPKQATYVVRNRLEGIVYCAVKDWHEATKGTEFKPGNVDSERYGYKLEGCSDWDEFIQQLEEEGRSAISLEEFSEVK